MKRTVIELLRQAAQSFGDKPFMHDKTDKGWEAVSFNQANYLSDWFAAALLEKGLKRDDKVAILSEGSTKWVISEYGILKIGAVSVPLSVKLQPDEILFRLNHSESKAIVVSQQTYERILPIYKKLEAPDFKLIFLDPVTEEIKQKITETGLSSSIAIDYETMITDGRNLYHEHEGELFEISKLIEEDDVVNISYTSGTTGNPKGIMLTHLNYWANSTEALEFAKIKKGIRLFVMLPVDHAFAHVITNYVSLLCPIEIYYVDSRGSAMNALKNIPVNLKEVKPEFLITVPALTSNFMKKIDEGVKEKGAVIYALFKAGLKAGRAINRDGLHKAGWLARAINYPVYKLADSLIFSKARQIFGGQLGFCIGGGALLDNAQQDFFYALGTPIFQGYGLTEATPIISINCEHTHKLGTSGKVFGSMKCRIVKPDGTDAKMGEKGEILIQGLNVMKGYFKNPEETARTIENGWLHTGDMGFIDEDGFLTVSGRAKALLISFNGEKYSPEGIEEAIVNSNELVAQVMIHNDHCRYTTAIITLNRQKVEKLIRDRKITEPETLLKYVKEELFRFKHTSQYAGFFPEKWLPATFRVVEESFTEQNQMINSTMKMVRYKIVETYQNLIDEMVAPDGNKINCSHNLNVMRGLIEQTKK
jgi:long-chain acyl-CoA synthetase